MKISNRAKSALATAGYSVSESSAIAQLVAFAAQNSGIELRNYYDPAERFTRPHAWREGYRAFRVEQRSISSEWRRFKQALITAHLEGVTDADVIAEAPHAFSGRLEWVQAHRSVDSTGATSPKQSHWNYCTGQYFPTEYRSAAATVLEAAIRRVRLARPPEERRITTIAELKALNEKNGGCWFGRGEMRFFGTHIESGVIRGRYFISSEQPPHGPRKYSVRSFDSKGSVETVGEFCSHATRADALAAIPQDAAEVAA